MPHESAPEAAPSLAANDHQVPTTLATPNQPPALWQRDCAKVLVVDDEEPMRHMLALVLTREGFSVASVDGAAAALEMIAAEPPDILLTDVRMGPIDGLSLTQEVVQRYPGLTVIVMSAFGSVQLALDALKRGAYDYLSKPFKQDEVVLTLRKAQERERLRRENQRLRVQTGGDDGEGRETRIPSGFRDLLIHSEPMQAIAHAIQKVAPFRTSVLITGESGVGKERLAQALHDLSPRRAAPFVAINCAAIPENLLESELFGHAKGSSLDALHDRVGLFEQARGGTLFLEEIGELPLVVQMKVLRALQDDEIRRIGDPRPIAVDVRIIAASSRALEGLVEDGSFRADLFYRLNVMPIAVPPLRERPDDIPPLVDRMIVRLSKRLGLLIQGVTPEAMRQLLGYRWPGNVRELENLLERAAVLSDDGWIKPSELRLPAADNVPGSEWAMTLHFDRGDFSVKRASRALEHELIVRALQATQGNRTHAAKLLELSHRALLYKIKSFGLG
jgi:two-component system response regulator AtoC